MQQGPALGSELWGKTKKKTKNKTVSSTVLIQNTKVECRHMCEGNDTELEEVRIREPYQSDTESGHHFSQIHIRNLQQSETPAGASWKHVRHAMRSMQRG